MAEPQPPEWDALRHYVNARSEDAFVQQCWAEAKELVGAHVGEAEVPESILTRAYLECGSELFHRQQAPNGITQFADFNGAPIRVARDPMVGAYPILRPFLGVGLA